VRWSKRGNWEREYGEEVERFEGWDDSPPAPAGFPLVFSMVCESMTNLGSSCMYASRQRCAIVLSIRMHEMRCDSPIFDVCNWLM
jgi:hypothetical protein